MLIRRTFRKLRATAERTAGTAAAASPGIAAALLLAFAFLSVSVPPVLAQEAANSPVFITGASHSVPEDRRGVVTLEARDIHGNFPHPPTYSKVGGADSAHFTLTGAALAFRATPDFEYPVDADGDNVYEVTVKTVDGNARSATLEMRISVTDVEGDPVFTTDASQNVPEGKRGVVTLEAGGPNGKAAAFSIVGGADSALFGVAGAALAFRVVPNHEVPADADRDNVYEVDVRAEDGRGGTATKGLRVTVTDNPIEPVEGDIRLVGGNSELEGRVELLLNGQWGTVCDDDWDARDAQVVCRQAGHSDSGAQAFIRARFGEGTGPIWLDQVQCSGTEDRLSQCSSRPVGQHDCLHIEDASVRCTEQNYAPVFTTGKELRVAENVTAVVTLEARDIDYDAVTFSMTGGADRALFELSGAALAFIAAPDYENPADADQDNVYEVAVQADDGQGNTTPLNLQVTVTDDPPAFATQATQNVAENETAAVTLAASNEDGDTVTFSIEGGADSALFELSGAALTFIAAPDYEAPADADQDNIYEVTVQGSDGQGGTTPLPLRVTVTNVDEGLAFATGATQSVAENETAVVTLEVTDAGGNVTFTRTGGADSALFELDGAALVFLTAPDYEAPADADTDNVYEVNVQASDDDDTVILSLRVTVTDVNDAPVFTTAPTQNVAENETAVVTLEAADDEDDAVTFSIAGGADRALFALDGAALTFKAAPDYEAPADADQDNVYEVTVQASDGQGGTTPLPLRVTVTNVERLEFATEAAQSVAENTTAVVTLEVREDGGAAVTFTRTGGADEALFELDGAVLTFKAAPDYEAPADADGDNVYEVNVRATVADDTVILSLRVTVVRGALTASFTGVPAEHDGENAFSFELRFSENFPGRFRYKTLRDEALQVTNGRATVAKRIVAGQNRRWTITVMPDSFKKDVTVALQATTDCAAAGAVCTEAGKKLVNTVTAEVPGPPLLTVGDAEAREAADAAAVFTVTRSGSTQGAVTVDYLTANKLAIAGQDYTSTSGTLTFAAGETEKTVEVPVLRDDLHAEGRERFVLRLSNASGGRIADAKGVGTILDEATRFVSAATSETGGGVTLTFTRNIHVGGAHTAYTVEVDGAARDTESSLWEGNTVGLVLSEPVRAGETVTVAYAKPARGAALQDVDGVLVANFGPEAVKNTLTPETAASTVAQPARFVSAATEPQGRGLWLEFTKDIWVQGLHTAYTVRVDGERRATRSAFWEDNKVGLVLTEPVRAGETVTVAYAKPSSGVMLHDTDELAVESFGPEAVENTVAPPLTATFVGVPAEHDGESAFTFELRFSENFPGRFRHRTLRDEALQVTNGRVTQAKRVVRGQNRRWRIEVKPDSLADLTVTLPAATDCALPGAVCTEAGRMLADTVTATVLGPALLSVADAEAREGTDAAVAFAVTLSRAASSAVTVDYATADGTATAGEDYAATSGTLRFAAGETEGTVSVPVLDDAVDEGRETFTLALSNADGAAIDDGEATGTIVNSDPVPAAWLSRFGRTVAEQSVDAVRSRMSADRTPGFRGRIAGEALPSVTGTDAAADAEATAAADGPVAVPEFTERERLAFLALLAPQDDAPESRTGTAEEAMLDTAFEIARETDGGLSLGLWGRVARSGFSGREGDMTLDGDVTSAMLGTDWQRRDALFGLTLFRSRGEGGYAGPDASGRIEAELSGLVPWAGRRKDGATALWGAAGTGTGEMTLAPEGRDPVTAGLRWSMAAAGAEGAPATLAALGDAELRWRADALATRTESEAAAGLAATSAGTTRLRAGLEASWSRALASGATLSPRMELGLRRDGGDAETGFGVEAGGGVRFEDPGTGLSVSLEGRALALHEDRDLRDWGLAVSLAWDPRPETRLGPSVIATRGWGGPPAGGVAALLEPEAIPGADDATGDGTGGLGLELAWGTDLSGWRHGMTGSAYGRVSGPDAEELRLGWRVAPDTGRPESLNHDFWLDRDPGDGPGIGAGLVWTAERRRVRSSAGIDLGAREGGGLEAGFRITREW